MSSIPRFFVPTSAINGDTVTLPQEAAHHAVGVLRMREGESIIVHDNTGDGYLCRLTHTQPKAATATVESRHTVPTEPLTRITVAQVLPKTGEKIEQVLQHGTEVGAAGFILFQSERSVARMEQKDKVESAWSDGRGSFKGRRSSRGADGCRGGVGAQRRDSHVEVGGVGTRRLTHHESRHGPSHWG
jgi:hypothetical protein